METLNLPSYQNLRTRRNAKSEAEEIWDTQRRRWVRLTPEEWVRQHFVHFLTDHRGYPAGRVGNEIAIRVGQTERRCDTVVFGPEGQPVMIVEYKAASVQLSQQTFDQISRYNIALQVDWLMVSNGLQHFCCHLNRTTQQWSFVRDLPTYEQLLG